MCTLFDTRWEMRRLCVVLGVELSQVVFVSAVGVESNLSFMKVKSFHRK
jgi:hypothetical protein